MGKEIHEITDNGLIIIRNLKSGKICTKLIARERQIRRYYDSTNREPPPEYKDILKLVRKHQELEYYKI